MSERAAEYQSRGLISACDEDDSASLKHHVIAGLDPAIHPLRKKLVDDALRASRAMDAKAFAAPKGLRPRRRAEAADDGRRVTLQPPQRH